MSLLKSYGSGILYKEYMTINTKNSVVTRRIFGLWDAFAKVGGITSVFAALFILIFNKYAKINFQLHAIDSLVDV